MQQLVRAALLAAAAAAATALCAAACSGPQVEVHREQRTVEARNDDHHLTYQFGPIGSTWDPITIDGNDAAWHDRASDGVVHVDHQCGRNEDTPLPALVQQLLIGFTEREFATEETVPYDGREARHVVVRARLDGVPMMLELYVMKKDGCVYDLGFVAPPDRFAAGAPAFGEFARGFHTIATGSPAVASGASR